MMILMLLIKMLNAEVKTKTAEGKISGTLSMMMRSTQDQPRQEEAEEPEATVAAREEEDSMETLEMNTTRGRHQPVIMDPDTKEETMIMIDINVPEALKDTKQEEIEEEVVVEEYPQSSSTQEDHPIICK